SAPRDASPHPAEVKVRACQSAKPDVEKVSLTRCFLQQSGDRASAESGFKPIIFALLDGLLQQRLAELPGVGVGEGQRNARMKLADFPGDGVGIENRGAFCAKDLLSDT